MVILNLLTINTKDSLLVFDALLMITTPKELGFNQQFDGAFDGAGATVSFLCELIVADVAGEIVVFKASDTLHNIEVENIQLFVFEVEFLVV